ncbi:MAG: YncE family protein, partial [Candidatus Dormibacteraceae bacterium]
MRIHARVPIRFWILSLVLIAAASLAYPLYSQQAEPDYGGPTLGEHGDTITPEPHPPMFYWPTVMPAGPGKALIVSHCQLCHILQRAIYLDRPESEWRQVIETMIHRGGPPATPDELKVMVSYMTENYGPSTKPRGITALQPCTKSEWPKGRADFRKPWGDSYTLWASEMYGGAVDIINPTLNKVVRRITCISSGDRVEFSPDGNTAYIPDRGEWNDTIVDTRTGAIIKKIPLIAKPNTSVLTKDGKYQIIAIWPLRPDESTKGYVQVVDTTSLKVIRTIATPGGIHDVWMSKGGEMFLAMPGVAPYPGGNHFMFAYDTKTFQKLWTCCTGPKDVIGTMEMEQGPDGKTDRIFVGYSTYPGIAVLD